MSIKLHLDMRFVSILSCAPERVDPDRPLALYSLVLLRAPITFISLLYFYMGLLNLGCLHNYIPHPCFGVEAGTDHNVVIVE